MRWTLLTLLAVSLFPTGCLKGPTGPQGKDGGNTGYTDSIIIDDIFPIVLRGNMVADPAMALSPAWNAVNNSLDTSRFSLDSMGFVYLKTGYAPADWRAYLEIDGSHVVTDLDSTNWIAKWSNVYLLPTITGPSNVYIGESVIRSFVPGKGFEINGFGAGTFFAGSVKIYYR